MSRILDRIVLSCLDVLSALGTLFVLPAVLRVAGAEVLR